MDNSPRLPVLSIVGAIFAGLIAMVLWWGRDADENFVRDLDGTLKYVHALNELEITFTALSVTLAIYAAIGLISVILEGRELRPGRIRPRLTQPLTIVITIFAFSLLGVAFTLSIALVSEWSVQWIGSLSGVGCFLIALLLVFYKEAFVGEEARFDDRDDGVPW